MIKRIKNWFYNYKEKRRREKTLEIIKQAKQVYLDGKVHCMCLSFKSVEPSFLCYNDIVERIPEYKPSTFGLNDDCIKRGGNWWKWSDRESRINAFNKLIEIYSK